MALYHVQPCPWDQLGSVGCHNFLKSLDEKTPLVGKNKKSELFFWFAKKTSSKHVFFSPQWEKTLKKSPPQKVFFFNRALNTPEALLYWSAWSHKNTKKPINSTSEEYYWLLMEEILHQLINSLYIPGGAGFLPSTVVSEFSIRMLEESWVQTPWGKNPSKNSYSLGLFQG